MSEADEQTAATATGREIWIEKYRPQSLDDIHGQEAIVERLQSYIEQDDIPTCSLGACRYRQDDRCHRHRSTGVRRRQLARELL